MWHPQNRDRPPIGSARGARMRGACEASGQLRNTFACRLGADTSTFHSQSHMPER